MSTQQAAEGAQQELAEKAALVEAAKARADALCRQLTVAKNDLNAIRQATYKAAIAARNAEANAARGRRQIERKRRKTKRSSKIIQYIRK